MDARELKQYESWKEEVQRLRAENQHLQREVDTYRPAWYRASVRIDKLEQRVEKLDAENKRLKQQVKELTLAARQSATTGAAPPPLVVKPPAGKRRRKRPGRKAGHPAALRPMPETIDVHQDVPLPRDSAGCPSCPHCNTRLAEVENHERIVEDIIPAKVVTTCYHTASGFCPCCRKRVESRAPEQPPAANIPHGQLGLNVLSTGVLLRVAHRLPFAQVSKVLADLPGITVYHIDKSRSGAVIQELLGKAFGGTLVSDFYSAYSKMNCKKQKCLVHLLRELVQTAEKSPEFAAGPFCRKTKRLIKQMLLLKGRWGELDDARYAARVRRLKSRLKQLADADYDEPHSKRLGKRLRKFRTELTAFLDEKDLAGTNNAAERAIRPVVVARKISGGSRSDKGAAAFAVVASLLRTAGQQGKKLLATIKSAIAAAWGAGNPAVVPNQESGAAR